MTLSVGNVLVKQNAAGTGPQTGELAVKFKVTAITSGPQTAEGNSTLTATLEEIAGSIAASGNAADVGDESQQDRSARTQRIASDADRRNADGSLMEASPDISEAGSDPRADRGTPGSGE